MLQVHLIIQSTLWPEKYCWPAVPKLFLIAWPFVDPVFFTSYHLENTLFQENSFYPISFNQKFGKPDLTQMQHEQHGCEKF